MLNITSNSISEKVKPKAYSALEKVEEKVSGKVLLRLIYATFIIMVVVMFLPWTQNIRSAGKVTTYKPNQRPQTIQSVIGGRLEQWFVREGQFVNKGDTMAFISETKDAYFDPQLLNRTQEQIALKQKAIISYTEKVEAYQNQLNTLAEQQQLLLQQGRIKLQQSVLQVQNDSIAYEAAQTQFSVAERQKERMDSLFIAGLKSKTDLEARTVKLRDAESYVIGAKNKYLKSQSDLIDSKLSLSNVSMKYQAEKAKLEAELYNAQAAKFAAENELNKLQNQYANYEVRNGMYYITAPQTGYVAQTHVFGIGEILKEGQELLTIVPAEYDLAVAMYIEPIDLPLLNIGQEVRIQFDGWPAIVFSGWPEASYGTYGGHVYAIDQHISSNGKYRILIRPDKHEPWPKALRYGSGTSNMVLLNDVPIWYEMWRQINGFPPDFYANNTFIAPEEPVKDAK